jgi:hypothetical protein
LWTPARAHPRNRAGHPRGSRRPKIRLPISKGRL